MIRLGVELVEISQYIFLEQLEDDQLDLDFHAQAAARIEEVLAECGRTERVGLVVELLADQGIQSRGQVAERHAVAAHDLGDHGIERHGLLQFIVLHQRQAVERHRIQRRSLTDFVLIEGGEGLEDFLQEAALDVLALQAQIAHRFEEGILLGIAGRPVRHLEQRIVGIVEQCLQRLLELLRCFVTHLNERHGQSSYRRSGRLLRGHLAQVHHIRISLHCDSPADCPCLGLPIYMATNRALSVTSKSWRQYS
ncbi:hypothetical protein D9M68_742210 [compost metagenome]